MNFEAIFKQIIDFFNQLNKKQKYIIIGSIISVVLIITFLIVYNSSTTKKESNYAILFENLKPQDAALIVQYLDKKQIPYKIPENGIIEVPKDIVGKVRLDVAAQGLPKSSKVGFEIFDKNSFGATDFEQRVKYLRALEGELAKTIESISAVESAKVNIAIPKESVFVENQTPPTASILIKLRPNMTLTPKQIEGIKWLVAAAVPKLKPENVKIVDQYGNPLGENSEAVANSELLKAELLYKKRLEKALEDKISSLIAPIVGGKNKVVAKVSLDIDFSKVKSKATIYSPDNVVRSEQTLEESRIGTKPKEVGGVPGAVSNIGPVQGTKNNQIVDKYNKTETTTNYEISTTIKDIKDDYPKIKRITAAVVVDGYYKKDKDGKIKFVPLSEMQIKSIENLVKNAIGIDPKRGDSVSVSSFQFNQPTSNAPQTPVGKVMSMVSMYLGPFESIFKYLFLAIVLFVFYKKVINPFTQKMLETPVKEEEPIKEEIHIDEEEIESTYDKIKELKEKVEQQLGISGEINEEELKYEVLLERVTKMVEDNPEQVAKVLENLLKEEHPQT
ncbi:flagellar basal body M-ring protein FliF [Caminibacter mediatlanticus TB-2]|uniref:Flagellar M-ring protein n=1 Tax=Caminibacter mediatlanticus TB-2 TaxID=391592 RepID=A0ABX5V933_9BACT|nr:flagellar basal-body MS-ring/collar protein FliF [Caminibacter mediatlanticus]QCT94474.1 flagellar basal body M-ring protein FliF [Caminibacter mediatlanticus TB-2]